MSLFSSPRYPAPSLESEALTGLFPMYLNEDLGSPLSVKRFGFTNIADRMDTGWEPLLRKLLCF